MANYDEGQGDACHIHLSLQCAAIHGPLERPRRSKVFDSFVAGLLRRSTTSLLYAPNINSYKRFAIGRPRRDDRVGAGRPLCRPVARPRESARLEIGCPAGTSIPIGLSAMIAGGLYGLDHDLELGLELTGNAHRLLPRHSAYAARGTASLRLLPDRASGFWGRRSGPLHHHG